MSDDEAMPVTVALTPRLTRAVDGVAKRKGQNRSALVRSILEADPDVRDELLGYECVHASYDMMLGGLWVCRRCHASSRDDGMTWQPTGGS